MNYEEAMNFIQNTNKFGSVLGLDNIKELLERLGIHRISLKWFIIAGTNGKGSSACISCRNLQRKWISCGEVCLPGIFLL